MVRRRGGGDAGDGGGDGGKSKSPAKPKSHGGGKGASGRATMRIPVLREQKFELFARLLQASFFSLRGDHTSKIVITA